MLASQSALRARGAASMMSTASTSASARRSIPTAFRTTLRYSSTTPPTSSSSASRITDRRAQHPSSSMPLSTSSASISSTSGHSHEHDSREFRMTKSPSTPPADSPAIQTIPSITLLRSYLVYTMCSIPLLIDYAPTLLSKFTKSRIPFLKTITEFFVRRTFFAQFVPGETVKECAVTMKDLRRKYGIGTVLNYSAEADLEPGEVLPEKERRGFEAKRLEEVERALTASGEFDAEIERELGGLKGSTSFALKVTGLIDPDVLARASTSLHHHRFLSSTAGGASSAVPYPGAPQSTDAALLARDLVASLGKASDPFSLKGELQSMGVLSSDEGLREGDLEELDALWGKLRHLSRVAKANGIKLMIDAEHTWYQPALDAFTLLLSQEFNKPPKAGSGEKWNGPLIFGTYQCYLVRQPEYLTASLQHAKENGYALGIKLVRGAYFMQERQKWKDEGRPGADPIWPDKAATDKAYDDSVSTILSTLSSQLSSSDAAEAQKAISVVFGTHNPDSCRLIVDGLVKHGLASPVGEETGPAGEKKLFKLRDDVKGKVFVAQLYGMKDDLTDFVAESFDKDGMPVALKYIAYGSLGEVLPFLGRRAIENKSLMSGEGGAAAERKRISGELLRRWFGVQPKLAAA